MDYYPLVSVYTCVYNGARTMHRVFKSMQALDYPNIEHIIVNDGSTDETDELIQDYMENASFPIKYYCKENGGKHTALNIAWNLSEGEFLIQLDADDELLPHSVRYLVNTYFQIPEDKREEYWCVHGRCVTQHGIFVGDKYPENINNQHWRKAGAEAGNCKGEKIGLQVRKYLNEYRFPEVVGLSHVPEGILWDQLNRKYGTWYTNEVVRVYYIGEGGNLTAKTTTRRQIAPSCYLQKWKLMHPERYGKSFKNLVLYSLFYFIADKRFRMNNGYTENLKNYKWALILLAPITYAGAIAARILKGIR